MNGKDKDKDKKYKGGACLLYANLNWEKSEQMWKIFDGENKSSGLNYVRWSAWYKIVVQDDIFSKFHLQCLPELFWVINLSQKFKRFP